MEYIAIFFIIIFTIGLFVSVVSIIGVIYTIIKHRSGDMSSEAMLSRIPFLVLHTTSALVQLAISLVLVNLIANSSQWIMSIWEKAGSMTGAQSGVITSASALIVAALTLAVNHWLSRKRAREEWQRKAVFDMLDSSFEILGEYIKQFDDTVNSLSKLRGAAYLEEPAIQQSSTDNLDKLKDVKTRFQISVGRVVESYSVNTYLTQSSLRDICLSLNSVENKLNTLMADSDKSSDYFIDRRTKDELFGLSKKLVTAFDTYSKRTRQMIEADWVWSISYSTGNFLLAVNRAFSQNKDNIVSGSIFKIETLSIAYPQIMEWKPESKYLFVNGPKGRGWIQCVICGGQWKRRELPFDEHTGEVECPKCRLYKCETGVDDLRSTYPHVAKWWSPLENGYIEPKLVHYQSSTLFKWICENGHRWSMSVVDLTEGGRNCPKCANPHEKEIREFIESLDVFVGTYTDEDLQFVGTGIFLPVSRILIEYGGYYRSILEHQNTVGYRSDREKLRLDGVEIVRVSRSVWENRKNETKCNIAYRLCRLHEFLKLHPELEEAASSINTKLYRMGC